MSKNFASIANSLSRRATIKILGGTAASAALGGCTLLTPPNDPSVAVNLRALADVHCHVFNITDLPAAEFVKHVFLEGEGLGAFGEQALRLVTHLLTIFTPDPKEELDQLGARGNKSLFDIARIEPENAPERVAALETFIAKLHKDANKGEDLTPAQVLDDKSDTRSADKRFLQHFYARAKADGNKLEGSLKDIQNDAARKALTPPEKRPKAGGATCVPADDRDRVLYAVRWVMFFTYYRHELLMELMRLQTLDAPGPRIFTPSLNDFDYWLAPEREPSPQSKQLEVMAHIAKMNWDQALVQPICAFDPLRQLIDEKAEGIVTHAVTHQGAAGIKIYPPMGYRPWGNDALAYFGPRVPKAVREKFCPTMPDSNDDCPGLGTAIDQRLARIYTFAADNDVAILTHVSRSQGAFKDKQGVSASERANARWWRELLDHKQGGTQPYKNLRINLGHAGGPWCLDTKPCEATKKVCAGADGSAAWFADVMDMLAGGDYPNVYADIADFDTVMDEDQDGRLGQIVGAWVALLKTLEHKYPGKGVKNVLSHVLYGSDWLLLGRSPGSGRYAKRMQSQVAAKITAAFPNTAADFERDLFFNNAVRFLGLDRGARTRRRLEKFLERDLGWIDQAMA